MKQRKLKSILGAVFGAAVISSAGCAIAQDQGMAEAMLKAADGTSVGKVTFTQGPNGALAKVDLTGLPEGPHAFHLHTTGACSPDFGAAGGHFNPTGKEHGFMNANGPHLGDTPNIHVPASGALEFELFLAGVTISGGENALLDDDGAAVVIHEGADDYMSNPAGAAGSRIVCGVIEAR